MTTVRNIIVYIFSLLFVLSGFSFVFAQEDPQLDIMQQMNDMRLRHKNLGDRATLVDKVVDGRNIFQAGYAHEAYKLYEADYQSLGMIYDHLINHEQYCPSGLVKTPDKDKNYLTYDFTNKRPVPVVVTQRDVVNVFSEMLEGKSILGHLETNRLWDSTEVLSNDDAFLKSCKWVLGCTEGIPERAYKNISKLPPEALAEKISGADLDRCQDVVRNLYTWYKSQAESVLEYDKDRDRDIYWNGIIEEDRGQFCDINHSIQEISQTISCSAEEFPQYSGYDPHTAPRLKDFDVITPDQYESVEEDDITEDGDEQLDVVNRRLPDRSVPEEDRAEEEVVNYLGTQSEGSGKIGPASEGNTEEYSSRLLGIPKEGGVDSLTAGKGSTNTDRVGGVSLIQNIQCEENEIEDEKADIDLYDEGNKLLDVLEEYGDELDLEDERSLQALGHPGNLTNDEEENHVVTDEPLIDEGELEELIDEFEALEKIDESQTFLQGMEEDFKSCIEEYTDEDPDSVWAQLKKHATSTPAVAICLREIFCREITDPSGRAFFRLRMCSIPARENYVGNTLPVMCISDSLDAQDAVVENMNNSGRMIRHIKTKEFLEFQAFGLDYSSRFVFSLNTNLRKPKKTSDPKVKKIEAEKSLEDMRRIYFQEYDDPNIRGPLVMKAEFNQEYENEAVEQESQANSDFNNRFLQKQKEFSSFLIPADGIFTTFKHQANGQKLEHSSNFMDQQIDLRDGVIEEVDKMNSILKRPIK